MKRPSRIYDLPSKVSDGTFLNEKEFMELQQYISDLERIANAYYENAESEEPKPQ